jgi:hypothetical protein
MIYGKAFYPLSAYPSGTLLGVNVNIEMVGSKIMYVSTENFFNTITDSIVSNSYYGSRGARITSTYEGGIIIGCFNGLWLYRNTGITVKRLKAFGNIYDIVNQSLANGQQENTFVGCKFDTFINRMSGIATSYAYCIANMKEPVNLKVNDSDGSPIEGATVNLYNNLDELEFSETTNSLGKIPEIEVLRYIYKKSKSAPAFTEVTDDKDFNPFRIEITYDGKQDYNGYIEIDRELDLKITMIETVPPTPPVYYQRELEGNIDSNFITGSITTANVSGKIEVINL